MTLPVQVINRANNAKDPIPDDFLAWVLKEQRPQGAQSSVLSDGIGLLHMVQAARALGTEFGLRQEGEWVTFWASMVAQVVAEDGGAHRITGAPSPDLSQFPADLQVYCIDDSRPMRRWMQHCMSACGATKVFGAEADDVAAFIDAVLRDGDIAICDQNLEYPGQTFYGTDLVMQLRAAGFTGLRCIQSANDTANDEESYVRSGAHIMLGKGLLARQVVEAVKTAYVQRIMPATAEMLKVDDASEGASLPGCVHSVDAAWEAADRPV